MEIKNYNDTNNQTWSEQYRNATLYIFTQLKKWTQDLRHGNLKQLPCFYSSVNHSTELNNVIKKYFFFIVNSDEFPAPIQVINIK